MKNVIALVLVTVFLVSTGYGTVGTTWNLTNDWSTVSNPGTNWSYGTGDGSGNFVVMPGLAANWIGLAAGSGWVPIDGGGNPINGVPGMMKATNPTAEPSFTYDFLAGDVVGHEGGPGNAIIARWTAPESGEMRITGKAWKARDVGDPRTDAVNIIHSNSFGFLLSNSGVGTVALPAHTRLTPLTWDMTIVGVVAGDTIDLRFGGADIVGMDMTIEHVPEPLSMALLGVGGLLLRRRKRA